MDDFPYPSDGDTALGYAIAVKCTRNAFIWLSARSLVACFRAVLPVPRHARVVLEGRQMRNVYIICRWSPTPFFHRYHSPPPTVVTIYMLSPSESRITSATIVGMVFTFRLVLALPSIQFFPRRSDLGKMGTKNLLLGASAIGSRAIRWQSLPRLIRHGVQVY